MTPVSFGHAEMEGAMIFAAPVVPNPAMLLLWSETSYLRWLTEIVSEILTVISVDFDLVDFMSHILFVYSFLQIQLRFVRLLP
jgi:hypothetical protein